MRSPQREERQRGVAIISANPETIDGLEAYLRGAGIAARGTRRLDDCARLITPATVAVVLFPDDFPRDAVLATLDDLTPRRARLLRVLVTGQLARFAPLAMEGSDVVAVPRPAWGFTILDLIRAHQGERGDRRGGAS